MEEKTDSKNLYIPGAIVIGAVIVAGAIVYAINPAAFQSGVGTNTAAKPSASGASSISIPVSNTDHMKGSLSAKVTIVEFSDFQCPFCQRFNPELQQALKDYGDKVRWVYKQFPLYQIHPEAIPAAEASECVWEQKGNNGFWEFADGVFQNQDRIGNALFKELAQKIGVNMDTFASCVSSEKYKSKIQADINLGISLGVDGTPTTFVNGAPLRGAVPYDQLKQAIDAQLQ